MIEEQVDSKGKRKFVVQKSHHPKAGNLSKALTEFFAAGWNEATVDYLDSVKELGKKWLKAIFDEAKLRVQKRKRENFNIKPKSSRSALHSDSEDNQEVFAAYNGMKINYFQFTYVIILIDDVNNEIGSDDDFYVRV